MRMLAWVRATIEVHDEFFPDGNVLLSGHLRVGIQPLKEPRETIRYWIRCHRASLLVRNERQSKRSSSEL